MFAILPRQIDPYSLSRVELDKVNSSYHLAISCQVGQCNLDGWDEVSVCTISWSNTKTESEKCLHRLRLEASLCIRPSGI